MYVCPNCNYHSQSPMNFCLNCGAKMVYVENQQPSYQQPYQQYQPYQQNPQYYEPQRPNNLGRKIPGMIMGITGFVFALLGILYVLIFLAAAPPAFVFGLSIGFSIESLPLSIIGRILCRRCIDEGDDSKMAGAGAGLGLAGIILTAIVLAIGIICLASI